MRSHKVLIIGTALTILLLIGAGILYWYVLRSPQVILSTSPDNATVLFDNAPAASLIPTSPGSHTLSAKAPGFVPYTKTIATKRGQDLHVNILLKPIPAPTTLSSNAVVAPSFIKGSDAYFLGNQGKTLYHASTNPGQATLQVEPMTPDTLSGVLEVVWRPDAEVAFLKRADAIYLYDFMRHDLLHQTNTLWGTNIDEVAWSPDGSRVVYTYYGPNNEQSLKFADSQNKNTTIVASLTQSKIDHPSLQWSPDGSRILLIPRSSQKRTDYMYTLDVLTHKITQLTDAGQVEGGIWSPDSHTIAYVAPGLTTSGSNTMILWIANADGSGVKPLSIPVTDIGKVTWTNNSQSLVAAQANSGADDTLVNVDVNGGVNQYQYINPGGGFSPQYLNMVAGDERVLFLNKGVFMSLPLITGKYE